MGSGGILTGEWAGEGVDPLGQQLVLSPGLAAQQVPGIQWALDTGPAESVRPAPLGPPARPPALSLPTPLV